MKGINSLTGKSKFLVEDLVKILSNLDQKSKIEFGVMDKNNNVSFTQDENFIFQIKESLNNEDSLYIITKDN